MVERIHSLVTPGAADNYASSLGAAVKTIEGDIEPKIKQQQGEAQVKLDASFSSLSEASSAAVSAKSAADTADKSWFECAAEEQSKRQTIEAASKSLASSRSNENESCQLQQDNKDFAFDAAGKYDFKVTCDFAVGDCDAKMQAFIANTLKKIEADAKAFLNSEQAKYTKLKASCDARTEERVAAQSALDAADSDWRSQRATCVTCRRSASPPCVHLAAKFRASVQQKQGSASWSPPPKNPMGQSSQKLTGPANGRCLKQQSSEQV